MPNEPDIQSLLGMLQGQASQSPMQQFSPLGQFGAGLAGLGAGMQGQPNPVLSQAQSQQDTQFRQRLEMIKLQQSVQKQREGQKKLELDLYRDLLGSTSPEGRKMGAQGIAEHLKGTGQQVSPEFVESFAAGSLSLDQRKQAYISVLAAEQDPILSGGIDNYLEKSLNIPKTMIPTLKAEAHSEPIHKLLYGQSLAQEERALARDVRDQARLDVLTKRQDLAEAKEQRVSVQSETRLRQSEERLDLSKLASERADKKFEWMMAHGPEEKRQRGLDQGSMFVDQWEAAANQLQQRGYLPPPGAAVYDPAYLSARAKRIAFPNDPYWTLFSKHLKADIVGYSRNVQGEIGPRFQQAFSGALGIADNPPDLESLKKVFTTMRDVIRLNREGKDTALFIYMKHPDGSIEKVPWKRGMLYQPGDTVVKVE